MKEKKKQRKHPYIVPSIVIIRLEGAGRVLQGGSPTPPGDGGSISKEIDFGLFDNDNVSDRNQSNNIWNNDEEE